MKPGPPRICESRRGAMQEQPILTVAETIQEILCENVVFTEEARPKR
jgi:hypothetical protein